MVAEIYSGIPIPVSYTHLARLTVIVVSVLAFVIAWNPNSSIMGLVSNAWAGLGACLLYTSRCV